MEATIIAAIITTIGAIIATIITTIYQRKEKKKNIELNNALAEYKKLELTSDKISQLKKLGDFEKNIELLAKENSELKNTISELQNRSDLKIGELVYISNDLLYKNREEIELDSFRIDAFPITNFQFQKFLRHNTKWNKINSTNSEHRNVYYLLDWSGNEFPTGKKYHPVVWVNWLAAAAFCNWRSVEENLEMCYPNLDNIEDRFYCNDNAAGFRLPYKNEHEKAALGGEISLFPWGNKIDDSNSNFGNHIGDTTYVGKYPPNKIGIYDMCGNIKEWCNDWHDETKEYKSFKNGSWASDKDELKCDNFSCLLPENTNPDFGFRCIKKA